MRFFVKKFERFGWTNQEGSKPALTKFIKISDYPVSAHPLLAEDDDTYFVDNDGFKVEKAVPLAGEEQGGSEEVAQQQQETQNGRITTGGSSNEEEEPAAD
jgi:hypothetical protein